MTTADVLGIVSVKGGVGKTVSAANIGSALAGFDHSVLLVDADFSSPNVGLHFDIVDPSFSVDDVLADEVSVDEAVEEYSECLDILPGSLASGDYNPFLLRERLEEVRGDYDYIVIDSSPTLNDDMLTSIIASDELLVVTTPDHPTLSSTLHAVELADEEETPIAGLLLNRVKGKSFELDSEVVEENVGVSIIGEVVEDDVVPESISEVKPVVEEKPWSRVSRDFKSVASELSGDDFNHSLFSHIMEYFEEKVSERL